MVDPNWAEISSAKAQWASFWLALVSTIFVFGGLIYAARTFKAQKLSTDVQSMLTVWAKLDDHWVRFQAKTDATERIFEFGQLISYYEIACAMFKNDVFTTSAAVTLAEHLRDVLPMMKENDHFKDLFEALKTSSDTYENISWFELHGQHKINKLRRSAAPF